VDTAFICGPEPMMLTIADSLRSAGLRDAQIRFELFKSGQPGRLPQRAVVKGAATEAVKAEVTLDGVTQSFEMRADQSLLEAALAQSIEAPYACTAGVCSTCKCRVTEGEVEMVANHALEDDQIAQGYRLACQSYPISKTVRFAFEH